MVVLTIQMYYAGPSEDGHNKSSESQRPYYEMGHRRGTRHAK